MTLLENTNLIKWMYFDSNDSLDVHNYVIQFFPELADIDKEKSKQEIHTLIERVVEDDYKKYSDKMTSEADRYNKSWAKYNDKYFLELSRYLEINWPTKIKTINASVGLIPVFPRQLDDFSFSVATGIADSKLIKICAHETLHFLWFEKWKQLHPETPRREFDSPHIAWKYSEMVTDPILNNLPFSEIFDFTERSYDSFYKLRDNDSFVMDNLREIYKSNLPIEEKINRGFDYINRVVIKDDFKLK